MYQCGIAADEVYAAGISCSLKCLCEFYSIAVRTSSSKHCDRCYGNTLVYNRYTVFLFYLLTNSNQIACLGYYLVVYLFAGLVYISVDTVQQ